MGQHSTTGVMSESSHAHGMVTATQWRVNGRPPNVKYFQVYLEDDDDGEDTLFMDSWIYLDTGFDEESADKKEKSHFVHKNQLTDYLNGARKSDDEIEVTQSESFPDASSPHTSQILPHSFLGERQVDNSKSPSVASSPHTTQVTSHASSSEERQVTHAKSPPVASSPHTSQTLSHTSTSGEGQITQVKSSNVASSLHTPQTLSHVASSGEGQVDCQFSQSAIHNTQDSDVLDNLNVVSPLGEYGMKKDYVTETSPTDISKGFSSPTDSFNSLSRIEINRRSTDPKYVSCLKMEGAGETLNTNVSTLFLSKTEDLPVYPTAISRHSEVSGSVVDAAAEMLHINYLKSFFEVEYPFIDSAKTSRQSMDMCSMKTENASTTPYKNVSELMLSEGDDFHENSIETSSYSGIQIISASVKSRKRSLSEGEIVIISDDEYSDESDLICIEPCISVCGSKNLSSVKKVTHKHQKENCSAENDSTNDITVIYEKIVAAKHNMPPRLVQTLKGTWASSSGCEPEITIE